MSWTRYSMCTISERLDFTWSLDKKKNKVSNDARKPGLPSQANGNTEALIKIQFDSNSYNSTIYLIPFLN